VLTRSGLRKATARSLADAAAKACLAQAGRRPGDVDMLINAGIYREDNMGEPALAALIQEDIGANLGEPPVGAHGTFSFDLLNGACGVITAIQLESGLLRSGVIRYGAIVTSDVEPDAGSRGAAALRPAGGAMLLGWDDGIAGFRLPHGDVPRIRGPIHQRACVAGTARYPLPATGSRAAPADHRREAWLPGPPRRLRRGGDPQLPA